ncbi:MAG: family 16 glycosylhydrolase [Eubacterium sp.]
MKKIILFVATLTASLCVSVSTFGALSVPETINISNMKLQWSDEFDGTSLNTNYWTPEIGNGDWGWGNNELEYYTGKEENITVSNGTLKINALSEKVGNYNYTSGRIKTADKVEVGYGYVEARIKLPSVNGIWPAFWMLGAGEPKGWPYCGEIDIMEAWNTSDFAQNCFHYADANGKDNYSNSYRVTGLGKTNWHTYGVYKTKEKLVFYYDGKIASRVIDITNPEMTEAHNNYYILLNVACGGNLANNIAPSAASLPASMEVDYVRYYVDKTPEELAAEKTTADKKEQETKKVTTDSTAPKKAKIKSLKNIKGKKIKLTIKKISGVKGFQIRYCDNKKFDGYITKNTTKRTVTIKHLKKKETYYVKVKAYKKISGKKTYGPWSKVKKVKIKK